MSGPSGLGGGGGPGGGGGGSSSRGVVTFATSTTGGGGGPGPTRGHLERGIASLDRDDRAGTLQHLNYRNYIGRYNTLRIMNLFDLGRKIFLLSKWTSRLL